MAYVKKIIGAHEKLHGIARLHWIYLAKGMGIFLLSAALGYAADQAIFSIFNMLNKLSIGVATNMMLVRINAAIAPIFLIIGGLYLMVYVLKVIYTEIALTNKRIIYKTGLLFVKVKEIDIEEISGENMDTGYFGSVLGYAYLMLDCRFVGDVTLPAISNANAFVKALHAARTKVDAFYPDQPPVAPGTVPMPQQDAREVSSNDKPAHDMYKPPEPKPYEEEEPQEKKILAEDAPITTSTEVPVEHKKEILQLEIAKLELEVKLKEAEADVQATTTNTTPQQEEVKNVVQNPMANSESIAPPAPSTAIADAPSATDRVAAAITTPPVTTPINVAQAQSSAVPEIATMPQVTDKIAEELIAQGLIPHPDEIKPEPKFDEERAHPAPPSDEQRLEPTKADPLLNDFAVSSNLIKPHDDSLKPAPAL